MQYPKKEQLTLRQFRIIKRLYALEELQGSLVAQEYGVSTRTLLRDMKKIATVIPLHRKHGKWSLNTHALDKHTNHLNHVLLSSFAQNIQIKASCLEKSNLSKDKISFAIEYGNLPKSLGEQIVQALEKEMCCTFLYTKTKPASQRKIDPVKLYTENGRWYLVSRDYKDDKIKKFNLSLIKDFKQTDIPVTLTKKMQKEADNIKSIWSESGKEGHPVKLYIKPEVAHYFEDIRLHKTQKIYDRYHDGGLELHYTITHKLEILPAIKSWLPHIFVLEPEWLREELMGDLENYRNESLEMDI